MLPVTTSPEQDIPLALPYREGAAETTSWPWRTYKVKQLQQKRA